MGQLVFQSTLGGQVNLVGPNTASTFNINVPAVAGNMVTTGDTGTVTNTMLAGSIANAKLTNSSVTVGSTSIALGASATTVAGLTLTTPTIGGGGANFNGSTSGAINLIATATAGSNTATLPAATGTVMVSGNMPTFSAYQSVAQSITSNVITKVQLQTKEFDTANCFDATTNYRFTPNVAGYYQVSTGAVQSNALGWLNTFVYKNGSLYKQVFNSYNTGTDGAFGTCIVYLNGSTDYIEFYLKPSTNITLAGQSDSTYFQAVMVRAA